MKDYQENTIYVRQREESWECFGKAGGKGMILENLLSEDYAVKAMTFLLWAVNEFGPEEYGTRMEEFQEAPEGVEFPVVKEESINE